MVTENFLFSKKQRAPIKRCRQAKSSRDRFSGPIKILDYYCRVQTISRAIACPPIIGPWQQHEFLLEKTE